MYDITNYSSFSHTIDWLTVINRTKERFPIVLLGSKIDLDNFREVPYEDGYELAKSMNLKAFNECSSKTGENVEESFTDLTRIMLDRMSIMNAENESSSRKLVEALESKFF